MEENNFETVFNEPEIVIEPELLNVGLAEEAFFSKPYFLSPSALSKFLWRPQAWYNWYVLNEQDDRKETKALIEGSLIHLLILEPHKFREKYCISKDDVIKDKQKLVVDGVYYTVSGKGKLEDHSSGILHFMKKYEYFQSLKTDEARIAKIITPQAEEYWEFLKSSKGKTLVSQDTFNFCKAAADQISTNKFYRTQLGMDKGEDTEVFNELLTSCEVQSYEFGFKGIFDNLVIDHKAKIITLNDVKTTTKTLTEFASESIEYFGYDLQLAMYTIIILENHAELVEQGYEIKVNIIAVNQFGDSYSFPVSNETLERWILKLKGKTDEFNWNWKNRNFTKQRAFVERSFVL